MNCPICGYRYAEDQAKACSREVAVLKVTSSIYQDVLRCLSCSAWLMLSVDISPEGITPTLEAVK